MTVFKSGLLAATAAAALLGSAAQAQFAIGATSINGAGASLPQNIVRQSGDCYGGKAVLGFGVTSGTPEASKSLFDFDFNTPALDTIGNRFNCAGNAAAPPFTKPYPAAGSAVFGSPRIVQPNVTVNYISTGSGTGVNSFLKGELLGTSSSSTTVPIILSSGSPVINSTSGFQFAVSETALSSGNITTYNNTAVTPFGGANTGTPAALFGPPIQVPLVVAPVAIAYDPVYAKERNNGGLINEYRFKVAAARADGSGGLKLTRQQYCAILNGTITNWNQLPAAIVDKDVNDPAPFDVPIRLVGRSETSGTTSVYTRAIAAQCSGQPNIDINPRKLGGQPVPNLQPIVNKFTNSENRLPYDASVTIAGTAYSGSASTVSPVNSLSGAFFDKGTVAITIGTEAAGLYGVANGNDGVAAFLNYHPDPSGTIGNRTVNGRIAYMSPEQALPATLFNGANAYGLNTASLGVNGGAGSFVAPDAKNANAAFAGAFPPESKGTAGAYCAAAATGCTPNDIDPVTAGVQAGNRANPLDWVAPANKSATAVAAPTKGYPIIGTSNILLYTCYATPERRQTVNGYVATMMGKTTKDYNNDTAAAGLFTDTVNGLFAKNGLAPLPASWRNAITETFLKKSVQVGDPSAGAPATTQLGLRNLWIQDKIPTAATGAGATTAGNATVCAGKPGA